MELILKLVSLAISAVNLIVIVLYLLVLKKIKQSLFDSVVNGVTEEQTLMVAKAIVIAGEQVGEPPDYFPPIAHQVHSSRTS